MCTPSPTLKPGMQLHQCIRLCGVCTQCIVMRAGGMCLSPCTLHPFRIPASGLPRSSALLEPDCSLSSELEELSFIFVSTQHSRSYSLPPLRAQGASRDVLRRSTIRADLIVLWARHHAVAAIAFAVSMPRTTSFTVVVVA